MQRRPDTAREVSRAIALVASFLVATAASCSTARELPPGDSPNVASEETPTAVDFTDVHAVITRALERRAFPGCVVDIGTSRGTEWRRAYGKLSYTNDARPVAESTRYDLASLTKVVSTTSVLLCLVRDDALELSDPVERFLSGFPAAGAAVAERRLRRSVTIEHLLTHTAGLAAWKPFYRQVSGYEELLTATVQTKLVSDPGAETRYSDLGFILLGECAARAGSARLDALERRLIFDPLAMRATSRGVPADSLDDVAPTERDPNDSTRYLCGIVHDENARTADGGVATGHAGLFSTIDDVARFARECLRAYRGDSDLFPRDLFREFVTRRDVVLGSTRALGWTTVGPSSSPASDDEPTLSEAAFGHTGFTGTSIWIDPVRDVSIVLLSNRVHPTRDNIEIRRVRRELTTAVVRAIDTAQVTEGNDANGAPSP